MMKEKTDPSQYSAPTLEKGLDILELLAEVSPGLTQNQIAARPTIRRSPSELVRMIEVLERRGYLGRTSLDSTYPLTLRMFELAHRQPPVKRRLGIAVPRMQELARTTSQFNHLVLYHDLRILVMAQVGSPEGMGGRRNLNGCRLFRRGR